MFCAGPGPKDRGLFVFQSVGQLADHLIWDQVHAGSNPVRLTKIALLVKLADAAGLGPAPERGGGSNPSQGTENA